jgi:hypothetical protein
LEWRGKRAVKHQMTKSRMLSKLDLAVVIACLAGFLVRIEHAHRIVIEAPLPVAILTLAAANPCPDNDNVADSASCLMFLKAGGGSEARRWRAVAERAFPASAEAPVQFASLSTAAPCSDRDNVPYSASCVEFLSGWLWRADAEGPTVRTYAP